jgi:hypothetical protein
LFGLNSRFQGMSVTKLRSKEEASMAAAKVHKVEEAKKPVSMHEEMRQRMMRRNKSVYCYFI